MPEESEREVLERIEATRARMGGTIEQIGDRVNPDRVQRELKARAKEQVREAKHNVKQKARNAMHDMEHGVNDTGRTVWNTIRENPIPAGMVGVGLAWLLANGSGSDRDERDNEYWAYPRGTGRGYARYTGVTAPGATFMGQEEYAYWRAREMDAAASYPTRGYEDEDRGMADQAKERVGEAAEGAKERVTGAAERVRDSAEETAERVKHKAEDAMDATRDKAVHLAHRASEEAHRVGYRARRVEHRVEHAVQDNPMAAGAIAAALGFAAGMMIPESQREHQMFGETRDRMMEKAETKARHAGEKVKDVAREAASEASETAKEAWAGKGADSKGAGSAGVSRQESFAEPRR